MKHAENSCKILSNVKYFLNMSNLCLERKTK